MGAIREPGEPTAEHPAPTFREFVRDPELQFDHFLEVGEGRMARVEVVQDLPRGVVLLAVRQQAGLAQQGLGLAFGAGFAHDEQLQGSQGRALFARRRLAVGLPEHGVDHGLAAGVRLVAGGGPMRVVLRGAGDQQAGEQEEFRAKVHASEGGLRPRSGRRRTRRAG